MKPLRYDIYKGFASKWGAVQLELQHSYFTIPTKTKFKNYDGRWIKDEWLNDDDWNTSWSEDDLILREGVIFIDITSTKAPNEYDWENKIVFALNVKDIGLALLVLEGTEKTVKIVHDPNMGGKEKGKVIKVLEISSPDGIGKGCMLRMSEKRSDSEKVKVHSVPISGDEAKVLRIMFHKALHSILCW